MKLEDAGLQSYGLVDTDSETSSFPVMSLRPLAIGNFSDIVVCIIVKVTDHPRKLSHGPRTLGNSVVLESCDLHMNAELRL